MWDVTVLVPDHCLSIYFIQLVKGSVSCKNGNSVCIHFLIISPDPYFQFTSGL